MHAIGVIKQKGGVGATTMARALAVTFAAAGWDVKLADMDTKQGTATSWQRRRLAADITPAVSVEMFGNVASVQRKAAEVDLVIYDSAPHASTGTVDIARASDLVVIPTGLSLDDLEPAALLANSLADQHNIDPARIVFALCRVGNSALEQQEARDYLGQTRFATLAGSLPQRPAYSRAHDLGLAVTETKYAAPRAAAVELLQAAVDKFNTLTQ